MKKNLITLIVSTFLSFLLLYFLIFIKIYFKEHEKLRPTLFKSVEGVNFHKKYAKKMHHIRGNHWEVKNNLTNMLFSTINEFSINNKNILFQGDSWIEQINEYKKSEQKLDKFAKENNYGLINAGITSFAPSLMQVQFEVLENDFNIKPNIVVAYIDQTDIGDEICRYKSSRVRDQNNNLIAVRNNSYSRTVFDYTQIYRWSEILLSKDGKLIKKLKFTNFFIKFKILRLVDKTNNILKFGWKNRLSNKCFFHQITNYLKNEDKEALVYFENRLLEYINLLTKKDYIDKIILVTFPHKNNLLSKSNKEHYAINVSDIVDQIVLNKKKIKHVNFTNLILEKKIQFNNKIYRKFDPGSHLKEKYHVNIFLKTILNNIEK